MFNNTHYFSTNILPLTGQDGTRPVRDGILVENQHAAGSSAVRYAIIIVYRFKDESFIIINIKSLEHFMIFFRNKGMKPGMLLFISSLRLPVAERGLCSVLMLFFYPHSAPDGARRNMDFAFFISKL